MESRGGSIPRAKERKHLQLDFSQLQMLTGDDNEFMIEILSMIVEESPGALEEMYQLLESKQYAALSGRAHKYKSTVSILGNQELLDLMKEIENEAAGDCRHDKLVAQVQLFDSICHGMLEQLQAELARLQA